MKIGIVKEIKDQENRVALSPAGVQALVHDGHHVLIEAGAGLGSGFTDQEYQQVGAEIHTAAADVWQGSEMIMKVKEPIASEYSYFRPGLILFTFLHLAAESELTKQLMEKKVTAIAYETIQHHNGSLPILTPMSEVAGRMAVLIGSQYLQKSQGGKGILLSAIPGVERGNVVILGGGVVGTSAAKMAIGLDANVTILDINPDRLRFFDDFFGSRIQPLMSNPYNIAKAVEEADLLIGAVLIPGARTPILVSEEMVKKMRPGSVIVDVAIDQGGAIATADHVTTHSNPTYERYGVIHYSVGNMPGAVPQTSTAGLTNATVPYVLNIAKRGLVEAVKNSPALAKGINTYGGHLVYKAVAEAHQIPYTPLEQVLA